MDSNLVFKLQLVPLEGSFDSDALRSILCAAHVRALDILNGGTSDSEVYAGELYIHVEDSVDVAMWSLVDLGMGELGNTAIFRAHGDEEDTELRYAAFTMDATGKWQLEQHSVVVTLKPGTTHEAFLDYTRNNSSQWRTDIYLTFWMH